MTTYPPGGTDLSTSRFRLPHPSVTSIYSKPMPMKTMFSVISTGLANIK
jgi:hypothetical protein